MPNSFSFVAFVAKIYKTVIMTNTAFIIPLNKKEVKGLSINYSFYETPFGLSLIASTTQGICYIGFGEKDTMLADLNKRFSGAILQERKSDLHKQALSYIKNEETAELPLHVSGTDFQLRVWQALLQIPIGKLSSYQAVANAVNNSKAVRAVGSAIGDNPVSYIIPCHRVIRSDGGLGGYFWGLEIKKQMIAAEKCGCVS